MMSSTGDGVFFHKKHVRFAERCLSLLPQSMHQIDTNRMTLLFYSLASKAVLLSSTTNSKSDFCTEADMSNMIEWVKSLYISSSDAKVSGFQGGTYLRTLRDEEQVVNHLRADMNCSGHLAMTYTALATLIHLFKLPQHGSSPSTASLDWMDNEALLSGISRLQQEDGSFLSTKDGGECDIRFVFCAVASSYIINNNSRTSVPSISESRREFPFDVKSTCQYIKRCLTYEGGFSAQPNLEAHGGSTFCAIASLHIMKGGVDDVLSDREVHRLVRWLVMRLNCACDSCQNESNYNGECRNKTPLANTVVGFNGRPNKMCDTCYSFWIGASLILLNPFEETVNFVSQAREFVLSTQDQRCGGLAKFPSQSSDLLHTYLGLAGLSLMQRTDEPNVDSLNLAKIDPAIITIDL